MVSFHLGICMSTPTVKVIYPILKIFFSMEIPKFHSIWSTELYLHPVVPQALCSLCSQQVSGGEGGNLVMVRTYHAALPYV